MGEEDDAHMRASSSRGRRRSLLLLLRVLRVRRVLLPVLLLLRLLTGVLLLRRRRQLEVARARPQRRPRPPRRRGRRVVAPVDLPPPLRLGREQRAAGRLGRDAQRLRLADAGAADDRVLADGALGGAPQPRGDALVAELVLSFLCVCAAW